MANGRNQSEGYLLNQIIKSDIQLAGAEAPIPIGIGTMVLLGGAALLMQRPFMEAYFAKDFIEKATEYIFSACVGAGITTATISGVSVALSSKIKSLEEKLGKKVEEGLYEDFDLVDRITAKVKAQLSKSFKKQYGLSKEEAEAMAERGFTEALLKDEMAKVAKTRTDELVQSRKDEMGLGRKRRQ